MDLVLDALIDPHFWAGAAFGGVLMLALCLLILALLGAADEALERQQQYQRTRNAITWPGTAERDTRGDAPRTRRSDLRSAPR